MYKYQSIDSFMLKTLQGQCVQGANLLQIFARKGKAAHIAFLVEEGYFYLHS